MDGYGYGGAGNPRDQITRALMQITAPPPQTRLPTPPPVPPRVPTMPAPGSQAYTAAMDNYNRGINDQMGGAPLPGSPAYTAAMDNYNRGINDQMLGITAPVGAAPPGMPTPMGPPRVPTMPEPGAPQGPAPGLLPGQQPPYPPQY